MSLGVNQQERESRSDEAVLSAESISKSFRHVTALSDVSITARSGEVVGLVGENGAGKSTLLNILTGVLQPDDGRLLSGGEETRLENPRDAAEKGISLVRQEQDVLLNLRGYENLLLGREDSNFGVLDREAMQEHAAEVMDELNIPLDVTKRAREYSFGQRQMLEIATAFDVARSAADPVILLDEPTAGLEKESRDLLFNRIAGWRDRATFVFVSHELDEVLEICDRIYVLKDGVLVDEMRQTAATTSALQQSMVGRETSSDYYKIPKQRPAESLGDPVLSADGVATEGEDGIGPVSFSLREGEIFGVVGVEGSGKTRLGRVLSGDTPPDSGSIAVGDDELDRPTTAEMVDAGIGYIPKDRKAEGLLLYHTVRENSSIAIVKRMNGKLPLLNLSLEREITADMIESLNIKAPGPEALVYSLSGGNQQKVVLGRWLAAEMDVIVMDNVTRGIDVGAKEEVYEHCRQLADDGVSIVFIGDELPEVIGMSNRIGVMKDGAIVERFSAAAGEKPAEEELIKEMV